MMDIENKVQELLNVLADPCKTVKFVADYWTDDILSMTPEEFKAVVISLGNRIRKLPELISKFAQVNGLLTQDPKTEAMLYAIQGVK